MMARMLAHLDSVRQSVNRQTLSDISRERWPMRALTIWRFLSTVAPAIVLTVALLLPLLELSRRGLSVVGVMEESAGYRYFHTLRILYGDGERPWLPQGQGVSLVYFAVHKLLDALGHPPTEIVPRFDLFAYLAAGIPLVVAGLALVWVSMALYSLRARLLAAVLIAYAAYDRSSFNGAAIVTPDYLTWAFPIGLVMAGWLIRLETGRHRVSARTFFLLGILTGACISTKPTYVVFVMPIYVWLLMGCRSVRDLAPLIGSGVLGIVTALSIFTAYYLGDLTAVREHFRLLVQFGQSSTSPESFTEWLQTAPREFPPNVALLAFGAPFAFALGLLLLPRRRLSLALLVGSTLAAGVAYARFYAVTLVETNAMSCATVIVWFAVVADPRRANQWFRGLQSPVWLAVRHGAALGVLACLVWWTGQRIDVAVQTSIWSMSMSMNASAELATMLGQHPGRTLYLTTENATRPLTIDSAIFKGGTDIHSQIWGVSPYVAALVPERSYLMGSNRQFSYPVDLRTYETLVFVVGPAPGSRGIQAYAGATRAEEWARARTRLFDVFGVRIDPFDCSLETRVSNNSLIVACARREETLAAADSHPATMVEFASELHELATIPDGLGGNRPVAPGDLVYVRSSAELFRVDSSEHVTRMVGTPGQRLFLEGRGGWHRRTGQFTGVELICHTGVTWTPTPQWQVPVVLAPTEATMKDARPGNWTVTPADPGVSFEWLTDDDGPFLRATATRADASFLLLQTPGRFLTGAPLSIRTTARSSRSGVKFWTTVYDNGQTPPAPNTAHLKMLSPEWATHTTAAPAFQEPIDVDRLGAGPSNLDVGDYVDIRSIDVFAGITDFTTGDCCFITLDEIGRTEHVEADFFSLDSVGSGPAAGHPSTMPAIKLEAGRTIYVSETGDLLRLGENGDFTRLIGRVGQDIVVRGIGPWDAKSGQPTSMNATFRRGRWLLATDRPSAANPDSRFRRGSATALSSAWTMAPSGAPVAVELTDDGGTRLRRLRIQGTIDALHIVGREPLTKLAGEPLTIETRMRVHRPGVPVELRIDDVGMDGERRAYVTAVASTGAWSDLTISAAEIGPPDATKSFSLVVHNLQAGDVIDLADMSAYLGLFP